MQTEPLVMSLPDPSRSSAALLDDAARRAQLYLATVRRRPVAPSAAAIGRLTELGGRLPDRPASAHDIVRLLDEIGSPATMASAGGRYFGLVIGGALPVTVAASWLAAAWDQNAAMRMSSPVAAALEDVALAWIAELLDVPASAGGALVTGASMASFTALAAARSALLARAGWDVGARGMFGAPPLRVVVGEEVHVTVLKALTLLGFGRDTVERVPVDRQGRMRDDAVPPLDGRTILCIQAGNVNTGAFDPAAAICRKAAEAGAWVHVDGAFGLWAACSPSRAHLTAGFEQADSWATDAHKWLNTPYDCGIALVRDPAHLRAAMAATAAYLAAGEGREANHHGPELSRRARAVEVWAALRFLGRAGVAEMVERTCRHAATLSGRLREAGFEILNEVVVNQILVAGVTDAATDRLIAAVQQDGTCWCGGTSWQGRRAMRVSISSWATTEEDIELSFRAIVAAGRATAALAGAAKMAAGS
jgi:glutamate/tyrosine decarboxylase-like PLP-dependent enzyme